MLGLLTFLIVDLDAKPQTWNLPPPTTKENILNSFSQLQVTFLFCDKDTYIYCLI